MSSFPEMFPDTPASVHIQNAPIRVLVAEPDASSRRQICSRIEQEPEMTIECINESRRLVSLMQETAPDLVIVDAHIPLIRRAGSWEALEVKSPTATVITAYDFAALTPFASIAVDLLLKPFDIERLETALDLAKSRIRRARTGVKADSWSLESKSRVASPQFLQRLAVEAGESIVLVWIEDIQWIQSADKYVRLHLGNTSHVIRRSMRSLQAVLDPNRFLRVHRNVIVNLNHVREFHLPQDGNMFVELNNGVALPLRKGNRSMIRKLLHSRL